MTSRIVWMRDAGTGLRTRTGDVGMDRAWWYELDFEEAVNENRIAEINGEIVRHREYQRIRPWPLLLPPKLPLDIYRGMDGMRLRFSQRHVQMPQTWGDTPAGQMVVRTDWNATNRDEAMSKALTVEELQDRDPLRRTQWLRLRFLNEETADMGPPLRLPFRGMKGQQYLALEDNDLYTPFDLSREEDYYLVEADGTVQDPGMTWIHAALRDRWRVALYLRPRRWRLLIEVLAHFFVVTGFELARHDQWYLRAYYDRPPVYPYRVDIRSAGERNMWHEYEGAYLSYDYAIEWAVAHSKAAAHLRREIYADQWSGLCIAWILSHVEPGATTIWAMPPRAGEIVCGIGVEVMPGVEDLRWVVVRNPRADIYPQRLLGQWWTDFFYFGGGA